jgi:putative effector of murein hydrolase LrgA (UPF0299 family)
VFSSSMEFLAIPYAIGIVNEYTMIQESAARITATARDNWNNDTT